MGNKDEDEGKNSNLKINLNGLYKALKQMEDIVFPFLLWELREGGEGGGQMTTWSLHSYVSEG